MAKHMYSLPVNCFTKCRDICTNLCTSLHLLSSLFSSLKSSLLAMGCKLPVKGGIGCRRMSFYWQHSHLYRASLFLKIKDSLSLPTTFGLLPISLCRQCLARHPKKKRKMTERGYKRRRESADAQGELDRALIDHSFRKEREAWGGVRRERRGRLMEERGGVYWVIHRIYEGQRLGRWEPRQA